MVVDRARLVATLERASLAQQELARRHLLDAILYADGEYLPGEHHRIVAGILEASAAEVAAAKARTLPEGYVPQNSRVIITLPPRHGKSRMVSEEFPAWVLGKHPDLSVIVCSYSAQLAFDFSRRARNRLADQGNELFGAKVSRDSGAVERWAVQGHPMGGFVAAGVGGPITGRGAHIGIIDDPFKNWQEAASPTVRDSVWEWYKSTFRTRLAPGGAIIIIMTRWHEDDLVGRLLKAEKEGGEKWKVINLPAVAEDDDLMGRQPGEALWPAMFPLAELDATKLAVGSYLWNALYQQRPRPDAGAVFKREHFRYYDMDEGLIGLRRESGVYNRFAMSDCWPFQTFDPSGSSKETADFCALGTFLVTPLGDICLHDVIRIRSESADQLTLIREAYARHRPQIVGIESKAMGLTLFQLVRNMGLPVVELKAEFDKVVRSRPVIARMEAGKVFFREGAPWLDDLEEELLFFPKGAHDDQVDMLSYAAILLGQLYQETVASGLVTYEAEHRISPI